MRTRVEIMSLLVGSFVAARACRDDTVARLGVLHAFPQELGRPQTSKRPPSRMEWRDLAPGSTQVSTCTTPPSSRVRGEAQALGRTWI